MMAPIGTTGATTPRLFLALDSSKAKHFSRAAVKRARRAEESYARDLRGLAHHIGKLISGTWRPNDLHSVDVIDQLLRRYAEIIRPWAEAVAARMLADVAARDRVMWRDLGAEIGRALHREIDTTPTGRLMQQRLADQVDLITSLPTQAAERVHALATEAVYDGTRAKEISAEIMRSGQVTRSRADLIARTEVGRTQTELVRARSEHIGSTHFVWRSAGDADVRKLHRHLNGTAHRWDDPPVADERTGARALPGAIYNCRCFAEPILSEK